MSIFNQINIQGVALNGLMAQPTQVFPNQFGNIAQMNITCHPDMKGYLPHIASYIHNFIAQRATQNLPRAIHFNMLVTQGNAELFILTTLIANMAFIRVRNGQMNDINNAITQCTDWAVTRRVNFITINVPDIFNQVQQEATSIQQMAAEYAAEAQNTAEAMSQIYMGGTSGFNGGNQQQQAQNGMNGGFSMTGQPASGFGNNNNNIGGFTGGAPATGFGSSNNQRGGIGGVIVRSHDANPPRGDRFSDDLGMGGMPTEAPRQQQQSQQTAQAPAPASSVLDQMDRGLNPAEQVKKEDKPVLDANGQLLYGNLAPVKAPWTRSRFQPHPAMFDGNRFDINRRGFNLEGQDYVVDTLKKAPVDRKALSLPPAAQFLEEVKPEGKSRVEFREDSMIKAAAVLSTVRELTSEADYLERSEELRAEGHIVFKNAMNSLPEALSAARQAAMLGTTITFGAYSAEFFHAKEFVVLKEDAKLLQDLSKSRTLATLVDSMTSIIQDPHANHSLRVAVAQLNFYLAQCWLEWLRFYVGIDEFTSSTSFIDDVLLMRDDIGDIAGAPFRTLVDKNQQRFIQTYLAFGNYEDSGMEVIKDPNKAADAQEKREVVVVPIMTPSMVVCTEFLDSEFKLVSSAELDGRDIGCNFDDNTLTPGFRKLVQTMVERPRSLGLQSQIRRFYVATLDGVVYEVNMGLNETAAPLLIKKVK
jgi:hypothetical protein